MEEAKESWEAYSIVERGEKSLWVKIGMAFLNRDQSINVLLDAYPRDGKVQLRNRSEKNEKNNNNKKGERS